jgi:hypothetical protein
MKSPLLGLLSCLALASVTPAAQPAPSTLASVAALPLCFEPCDSPSAAPNSFLARGASYEFFITPAETQIVLAKPEDPAPVASADRIQQLLARHTSVRAVRMQLVGANPQASLRGEAEMPGKINYLKGNVPSQWRTGIPTFAKVRVVDAYPGIDLLYYGNQRQLEYDFSIAPGARPSAITLHFDGADKVSVNAQGELVLTLGAEEIRQPRPVLYQLAGGVRKPVSGGYELRDARTVGFKVGAYDASAPLVIDPFLAFSTYFGGNFGINVLAIALDAQTNVYIAGETLATEFIALPSTNSLVTTNGVFQSTNAGGKYDGDAFVAEFNSELTANIYFTYLGGNEDDGAYALAVDAEGHAYVTGFTTSTNFPTTNVLSAATNYPPFNTTVFDHISGLANTNTHRFDSDVFITELETNGSKLIYSTYLGGEGIDVADKIAIDPAGDAFVTGYTTSSNFPMNMATAFQTNQAATNSTSAFLVGIATNANGTNLQLVYSSFLGGTNVSEGEGLAVVGTNLVFVTGFTSSTNFPTTTNALIRELNGSILLPAATDGFIALFNTTNSGADSLPYCSLLGGINNDVATRVAVDAQTNVFITGYSASPNLTNLIVGIPGLHLGLDSTATANQDVWLTRMTFDGLPEATNVLLTNIESVLFGGLGIDIGWDLAIETNSGNVYIIGLTTSTNFPTTNTLGRFAATNSGRSDVFVTVLSNDLSGVVYSGYLGGRKDDYGYAIAVDPAGNAYIAGRTLSTNFPTVNPLDLVTNTFNNTNNGFLAKILLLNPPATTVVQTTPTNVVLEVIVDGVTNPAPVTNEVIAGSEITLSVPPVQITNGLRYVWTNWSDGGTLTHTIIAGSNGVTLISNIVAEFDPEQTNDLALVINGSGTVSPNLNGQTLEAGHIYTLTAHPRSGFLFAGWTGSFPNSSSSLTITGADGLFIQANFIPNPFPPVKGNYAGLFLPTNSAGLFLPTNEPGFGTSGYFSASLSSHGSFSARFRFASNSVSSVSISGQFTTNGFFSNSIPPRGDLPALSVLLNLDLTGSNLITGTISDGTFTNQLSASLAIFTISNPAPESPFRYTLAIPGSDDSLALPGGDGYGFVTVNTSGVLSFSGKLGDGTSVSQSTYVSPNGTWPFFISLYSHGGAIIGSLTFADEPTTDVSGPVSWLRPNQPHSRLYPAGFSFQTNLIGSIFTFIDGAPSLALSPLTTNANSTVQGEVILQNGGLARDTTNFINIGPNDSVTNVMALVTNTVPIRTNQLSLSISGDGSFSGSAVNPGTGKRSVSINGALLQKANQGFGQFINTNQTGRVRIQSP